jgi:hypothetical protein
MSQLALIVLLGGGERPDHTLPGGRPDRPDQGLPPGARPDQGLPGHGHPDAGLPTPPVTPDNTLPDTPENAAPPTIALPIVLPKPPTGTTKPVEPNQKFELKYSVRWGWVLTPVQGAQPK